MIPSTPNPRASADRTIDVPVPSPPARAGPSSQGEMEAAICTRMSRLEQQYMGRGPRDIRTYLLGDLIVIRLSGVLTVAEQHLLQSTPSYRGRGLLKKLRIQLVEVARPALEAMVQEVTGVQTRSLHHDISTQTGEEVLLFSLTAAPMLRADRRAR